MRIPDPESLPQPLQRRSGKRRIDLLCRPNHLPLNCISKSSSWKATPV
jgi:hypothetical protein